MGDRYLTDLARWCRDAGLRVVEVDGWRTRARKSGGFDTGRPWAIAWHHTASRTTAANDVAYIVSGSSVAPIANLYLARGGEVWVCAAGATNTEGKGGPMRVSKGTIPVDQGNTYCVSIEAGNNGIGEEWPVEQIDAYFTLNNALVGGLDLLPTDLITHAAYAPTRKIDPARAEAIDGDWWPRSANSSGSWNLGDVRDEALRRAATPPPDPPPDPVPPPVPAPPEEDTMRIITALDANGTIWVGDGITRRALDDMADFNNYILQGSIGNYQFVNTSAQIVRDVSHVHPVDSHTLEALGRA